MRLWKRRRFSYDRIYRRSYRTSKACSLLSGVTTASPCAKIVRFKRPSRKPFSSSWKYFTLNYRQEDCCILTFNNFATTRNPLVLAMVHVSIFWVVVAGIQDISVQSTPFTLNVSYLEILNFPNVAQRLIIGGYLAILPRWTSVLCKHFWW